MSEKKPVRGVIVEDETVVGGVDAQTGAPVVAPKTPQGEVSENVTATDPRERHQPIRKNR